MAFTQGITHPGTITVFGSHQSFAPPDLLELDLGVFHIEPEPSEAFAKTRAAADELSAFIDSLGLNEARVSLSRMKVDSEYAGFGADRKFLGYMAGLDLKVLTGDLDQLERLTAGAIESGATAVKKVVYHCRRTTELRVEARRLAVVNAREKAAIYAEAADAKVGRVVHIEDRNPAEMRVDFGHGGVQNLFSSDDDGPATAGAIAVQAAVMVSFAIL